jgi:AraC family transcriptional regulator
MTVSSDIPTSMKGLQPETRLLVTRSREWVPRVLTLLDAAIHQLHHQQEAHTTILMATSLLRQETDPDSARQGPGAKGRLLAWQVRKVREYVNAHLATRILLADLCALVRLGEAHFSRVFKRTLGESPHAFVIRRRLEVATDHMLHTDASLRDIALECGFTDQAHFTKSFRRAMGQTPAAWRRAHDASDATRHRWPRRHSRDLRGRLRWAACPSWGLYGRRDEDRRYRPSGEVTRGRVGQGETR